MQPISCVVKLFMEGRTDGWMDGWMDGCTGTDDAYRKITLTKLCTMLEVQFL